ncbi:putative MFS family arabinose efflux permease [Micromonospora vinacea]|uniref:MFS family arabinose efflux permease n=1 Tax=Micromonospora vinacea TaxID=709878 RepID=A0ABS0KC46_9ACTN|nr:MFS transporter [Micromonospora vinacea]MBG6106222.1 putative MFS family arabinose efflux permease [Micromonospora vinacea]
MRRVYLLALGSFAIGTDTFVTAGVLPAISGDLHVSVAAAGQLVTIFAVAFAVFAPLAAALLAGVPRRTLLLAALGLFAAANLLSALAPDFTVLLLTRVLAAAGAAAYTPTAAAGAAALVEPERRGRALAVVLGGITAATVLGVPITAYVGMQLAWRATFLVVAGLAVLALVALAVVLPAVPAPPPAGLRARLAVLAHPQVLLAILTTVLYYVGGFVVYTYLAPALSGGTAVTAAALAGFLLVFGVAGLIGNALGGRLTDRAGAAPVLLGGLAVFAAALLLFPAAIGSVAGTTVVLAVWGVSAWALTVPQQHRLMAFAPGAPAVAIGLNSSATFLGIGLSGLVGGVALDTIAAPSLGYLGGALVVAALGVAALQTVTSRRVAVRAAPMRA